ncbi:MAG: septation regulator SpoVG [Spirochaetes bacterium]|uniref:Septation regulator SpoVG n=1 Tax=Candidatus Ornithospirochaeta stercoravium TaxID=2840897 RepID=A0A9D9IBE8_9SPIO|nr:septation regulator SpoVG [Candidatus Ornithospirochaeta stercoravium]
MEITDIRVRKIDGNDKLKAYVTVAFDNEFAVHNIKIIESQNGLFIAMPSRTAPDGSYKDIAHPISTAFREKLQGLIIEAYSKA